MPFFVTDDTIAVMGGTNGYVGLFDLETLDLTDELSFTNRCVHGIWGDGGGAVDAVGGRFSTSCAGIALIRE